MSASRLRQVISTRNAIVYLRQISDAQVEHMRIDGPAIWRWESKARVPSAGPTERIIVIDEDLGLRFWLGARSGFARLPPRWSFAPEGSVLGLEARAA